MKQAFYRKRRIVPLPDDGKMTEQVIRVRGFADDHHDRKAELIISVMTGSDPRATQRSSQKLCDELNAVWNRFYGR